MTLPALVLSVALAASSVHVFGVPGGEWIVVDSDGVVLKRFRELHGVVPDDVAVSSDGKRWAMVQRAPDAAPRLYLFREEDRAPRVVTGVGDAMDGVHFSHDGEWLYLSANDVRSRAAHSATMSYAQIYRVRFSSPTLVRLSSSRGCHMWPRVLAGSTLVFAHADCAGGRGLSTLSAKTGTERSLLPLSQHVSEVAARRDGSAVFYVAEVTAGVEFRVWRVADGTHEVLLSRTGGGPRLRPQWSADGTTVLFQEGRHIRRVRMDGAVFDVAMLGADE